MSITPVSEDQTRSEVVGLGAIVVDEQLFVDRIPSEDEKEKATKIRHQIGGPVPTALATLRRFERSCHFIGPWGDDPFGDLIEKDLRHEGICNSPQCRINGAPTGRAHVWTSNHSGSRTIVSMHCQWDGFQFSDADKRVLENCRILHLDGTGGDFAVTAARVVRNAGGEVFLDTGSPKEATSELIPLCTVVSFPERFIEQFFGHRDIFRALDAVRQLGPDAAICTRGDRGAVVSGTQPTTEIPAYKVKTIDSTGAGDVFCGGTVEGLLQGLEFEPAVRLGAAAAAIKCQRVGNREALPCPKDVARLIAKVVRLD